MGYRIFLGQIPGERLEVVKEANCLKELSAKLSLDLEDSPYKICDKVLHCFGKYIEWTPALKEEYTDPVFNDKKLNEICCNENDFYLLKKDGLKFIINVLNDEITSYYETRTACCEILEILVRPNEKKKDKDVYTHAIKTLYNDKIGYVKYDLSDLIDIEYKDLYLEKNKKTLESSIEFIINDVLLNYKQTYREYKFKRYFNLDESSPSISNSPYKDKVVLELVHILKTFDFESNHLLIYGH